MQIYHSKIGTFIGMRASNKDITPAEGLHHYLCRVVRDNRLRLSS